MANLFTLLVSALATTKNMDKTLLCSDGLKIAYKQWKSTTANASTAKRVLCLHGWLDNCESFHLMGPALAAKNHDVVALDVPGHGWSDHKPQTGPSHVLAEGTFYIKDALNQLNWCQDGTDGGVYLVGHSMGAAIAQMFAATFPEDVKKLVLLDGAGAMSKPASSVSKQIRSHIEARIKGNGVLYGPNKPPSRVYPSFDMAVTVRQQTARMSPGNQYLSLEAASAMVKRATKPAQPFDPEKPLGIQFRHDSRLHWPSLLFFTPEHALQIASDVTSPTCLLRAEDGWPISASMMDKVLAAMKPQVHKTLPGSHHFHADPASADGVIKEVLEFFDKE